MSCNNTNKKYVHVCMYMYVYICMFVYMYTCIQTIMNSPVVAVIIA